MGLRNPTGCDADPEGCSIHFHYIIRGISYAGNRYTTPGRDPNIAAVNAPDPFTGTCVLPATPELVTESAKKVRVPREDIKVGLS